MKLKYYLAALLVAFSVAGFSKEYRIKSAADLSALPLKPGDKVILKNGNWKDQELNFKGQGTPEKPIILQAEDPQKLFLSGRSSLKIDGKWLLVDGLNFRDGFTTGQDVILFSSESSNCRLTNSTVVGFNPKDSATGYTYASLYGDHNRVDHCYFEGKTNTGPTLVVWLSNKPNYHQIDHNYFGPRPDFGGNGGETIRIGTSDWSMYDSFTKVDSNVFARCNGETEIVSVKSCRNTISNNLFFESVGTLTLRHGNFNEVFGNVFIGNKVNDTGGIRIIGENHRVYNNYLQGLTGTGLRAAISVMDGLPNPILTSHWQVKNATVLANTIVDCKEAFSIGAGKNSERVLAPQKVIIANNLVRPGGIVVSLVDSSAEVSYKGNMLDSSSGTTINTVHMVYSGFVKVDAQLRQTGEIWSPEKNSPVRGAFKGSFPFIQTNDVGAMINQNSSLLSAYRNIGPRGIKTDKVLF